MKKVLIGLLALGSLSAFSASADDRQIHFQMLMTKDTGTVSLVVDGSEVCSDVVAKPSFRHINEAEGSTFIYSCNFKLAPGKHSLDLQINSSQKSLMYYWIIGQVSGDLNRYKERVTSAWQYGGLIGKMSSTLIGHVTDRDLDSLKEFFFPGKSGTKITPRRARVYSDEFEVK